ncbi:MAG: YbaN family protein [Clostridia bacterium]|nr:YbaN family protein [Clostridia bacterium]
MKIKKIVYIVIGCIGLALGAVGAVVPMLPAFPFLLLAAFCFGKSSERLHNWFTGTKLYKNNLESYVKGQGMTWKTKIKVMVTVTILMAFGFFMMFRKELYIPCGILGAVWIFHIIYFCFLVKTRKIVNEKEASEADVQTKVIAQPQMTEDVPKQTQADEIKESDVQPSGKTPTE